MNREISAYEKTVINRIEEIRERDNVTQESFAELMGIGLNQYRRFTHYQARVSLEAIHNLANAYAIDVEYILNGKHKSKYDLINAIASESFEERAKLFSEIASLYYDRHIIASKEKERRNDKNKEKNSEKNRKNSSENN